ncbi:hypothetical protein N7466_001010 [Penicillium verhagenii]|uniref:uncharacterized protein n=1 Tax=Penicillium verhagenii TaxID=1562060 RepID=UPI00254574FC|nr:uncharacterized protein N7466_001010 [Penicillium verhagenii]KAJ5947995.1 hypothetical protein N7466_001010 [Penicillium verhagenii]
MESSPGTGDLLAHGPPPDASQTSTSPTQPEPVSEQSHSLSRSSSLSQNKRPSLSRANTAARHAKRLTLNLPIHFPLNEFPAATPDSAAASPASMTPVTQSSSRPSTGLPALPTGTPIPFDVQDDGYDFLRAIASQERKVMELREELQRAEADLSSIKKQWALSEKSRKRTEISHHAEPMLPLRSPDVSGAEISSLNSHRREQSMSSVASSGISQERISRELDRRSSIRATPTIPAGTTISSNGRRVFQGSHARTLSLLSPVTATSGLSPGLPDPERIGRTPRSATLPSVERMNTVPSMVAPIDESQVPEHLLAQWRKTLPPPSREALMRTGKQMASDLREGLWTFLEDIRQATVGEEGINGTESRTVSSPNSLAPPNTRKRDSLAKSRSRERLSVAGDISRSSSSSSRGRGPAAEPTSGKDSKPADIASSFWHEFGVDSPAQKSPGARRNPSDNNNNGATTPRGEKEHEQRGHRSGSPVNEEDDTADNWDVWDTPLSGNKMSHTPSSSRSTVESKHDQSPTTQGSSPRTSASFGEWNPNSAAPDPSETEGIPWPVITKLAPSKLQRTASNLMAEWERSLSPSPERKDSSSGKSSKKD